MSEEDYARMSAGRTCKDPFLRQGLKTVAAFIAEPMVAAALEQLPLPKDILKKTDSRMHHTGDLGPVTMGIIEYLVEKDHQVKIFRVIQEDRTRTFRGTDSDKQACLRIMYVSEGMSIDKTELDLIIQNKLPDIHDNFFDLEENSLIVAQVITVIEKQLRSSVSSGFLQQSPTISEPFGKLVKLVLDESILVIAKNSIMKSKVRGFRIELGEIDNQNQEYHKIKQAVADAKEVNHEKVLGLPTIAKDSEAAR
ncbi:hypothetical protein FQA39_LY18574 [Lamprigera yunnana]|nr:hypothetical protein FQA39_LY18574 [Lamprigera yunnana]